MFGVHRNTVRAWIKAGLSLIDDAKPALIRGAEFRRFLEARRHAARCPSPPGKLYCFSCKQSRAPALGMADFIPRETGAGALVALCEACGTAMHRRARFETLAAILPGVVVQLPAIGGDPRDAPAKQARAHSGAPATPLKL